MSGFSDYLENKLIDFLMRGEAFVPPESVWVGLVTSSGSDSTGGTEVDGDGYERVEVECSLANWSGTQGASTTTASSGTSGTISNNVEITFPEPTGDWGQVVGFFIADADEGGNRLWYSQLSTPKTINNGDAAPSFAAGALTLQIDD